MTGYWTVKNIANRSSKQEVITAESIPAICLQAFQRIVIGLLEIIDDKQTTIDEKDSCRQVILCH